MDQTAPSVGLTKEEVQQRIAAGKVNVQEENSGKTVGQIIRENVCTYFNAIFLLLAILLIIGGAYNSLTFLPVIIINTLIGIIQQVQSKKVIDRLTLLTVTEYTAVRDGKKVSVKADRLVQDDVIFLTAGQQIPADCVVISGEVNANESLLTGEADEIAKKRGAHLLSGSFVVSGECLARLEKVGAESYAARLTAKAKETRDKQSEMVRDIDIIVKIAGILIIPIGTILFVQSIYMNGNSFSDSVVSAVGAVIGMIPEGLYLLVTVALAMSAMRLAMNQVLLHDMRSIEALARVDVICVDKTGTITGPDMTVTGVFAPDDGATDGAEALLKAYVQAVPDRNATALALQAYLEKTAAAAMSILKVTPFDSKKKYSEVAAKEGAFCLGAPEYVASEADLSRDKNRLDGLAAEGKRVIAFAKDGAVLLYVSIENGIRENAKDTFTFFNRQGVAVKVISGDNPLTVSKVAERAGIKHADTYVDMTSVRDNASYTDLVKKYTVFGRVRPEQKKALVRALRQTGKKVAMTGDGVNDILAMKEADCSIAMGSGCEAAANAAQVVLLDSDFSHMKQIVSEGRRNINNITRSATLFLYKNLFSLFLAVFAIINVLTYPLQPSQVTLISTFNIGIPAFFLAFEANTKKQEGKFIRHVFVHAMPAALTSFLSIAALVIFGQVFRISDKDVGTASTFLLAIVGFMILYNISQPMTRYRIIIFFGCIAGMIAAAILLPDLFSVGTVSTRCIMLFVVFAIAEESVMRWLTLLFEHRKRAAGKASSE